MLHEQYVFEVQKKGTIATNDTPGAKQKKECAQYLGHRAQLC